MVSMSSFVLAAFLVLAVLPHNNAQQEVLDNCDQRGNERVHCRAGGKREVCENKGCFFCVNRLPGEKKCIRGKACKRKEEDLTEDDNGWEGLGEPNSEDCFKKYHSAWCPKNKKYKCVRDFPKDHAAYIDNCAQDMSDRKRCSGKARGNRTRCHELGCYFCDNGKPKCIEGLACKSFAAYPDDICWDGVLPETREKCVAKGCSWCNNKAYGRRCVKHTVIRNPPTFPPPTLPPYTINNCAAITGVSKRHCGAGGDEEKCKDRGCYYCEEAGTCVEGLACNFVPTPADNCWRGSPGEENAEECMNKYGCSWCELNPRFRCVRDTVIRMPEPPTLPPSFCVRDEILHCLPYDNTSITEDLCHNIDPACEFCEERGEYGRCVRDRCPTGFEKRYKADSCCRSIEGTPQIQESTQRIFGGEESEEGQWPFAVVVIGRTESQMVRCSGSLVSKKHVITAAHCLLPNFTYSVMANSVDMLGPNALELKVRTAFPHEGYNFSLGPDEAQFEDDVMVLELEEEIVESPTLKPLAMPQGEIVPAGQRCIAMSWGATWYYGDGVTKLREVALDVRTDSVCFQADSRYNMSAGICANRVDKEAGICWGDSGGPLACQRCHSCEWYLAGISSLTTCFDAYGFFPGYFARVSFYEEWFYSKGVPRKEEYHHCFF